MSDLRLEQIVVSEGDDGHWLYGLDQNGTVWYLEPGNKAWVRVPMVKFEGPEVWVAKAEGEE